MRNGLPAPEGKPWNTLQNRRRPARTSRQARPQRNNCVLVYMSTESTAPFGLVRRLWPFSGPGNGETSRTQPQTGGYSRDLAK
ncbi:hypothetical protein VTN96DRAFT_901 [Rasamsonia emersonii]